MDSNLEDNDRIKIHNYQEPLITIQHCMLV